MLIVVTANGSEAIVIREQRLALLTGYFMSNDKVI